MLESKCNKRREGPGGGRVETVERGGNTAVNPALARGSEDLKDTT